MSRLIDADKLENDIAENITVKAVSRMLAITQGQPTVKAIPISMLRRWLNKQDMPYKDYVIDVVEHAINAWEKENEKS